MINSNNQVTTTAASTSIFPQTSLQFPSTATTATATPALSTFPFSGFATDTQRHAMQILAAVSASSSLAAPYNILSYIPPLPPAPPPFPLLPNTYPSSTTSERLSPSIKRPHDDPSNDDPNDDSKRARYHRSSTHNTRSRNFDEENIAPVPSLLDANINTLKKYVEKLLNHLTLFFPIIENTWA